MGIISLIGLEFIPEDSAFVASLFISGIIVWFLGKRLNADSQKVLVDPETGQQYKIGVKHSLFFIPLQYWGPLFVLGSIYMLINLLIN